VIDLENLVGSMTAGASVVAQVFRAYVAAARSQPGDRWAIATSHFAARRLMMNWPQRSGLRRLRSGPSGADHALLDIMRVQQNLNRVGRVVIGSGDGIFAGIAAELRSRGIRVIVVARKGTVAWTLRRAVDELRLLPPDFNLPTPRRPVGGSEDCVLEAAS